jgi:flagellum-specific ATP synthase
MSNRLTLSGEMLRQRLTDLPNIPGIIGKLAAHDGTMLEVSGFPLPVGTMARIHTLGGNEVTGQVAGFRGHNALVLPLERDAALGPGQPVEAITNGDDVICGPGLLGRVIDAQGRPLDELGPIHDFARWPLRGKRSNPLERGRVERPLDCGVRAINALLTLGEGQRVALIAGSGVGKSVLMGQILAGTACDILIVALVGERSREVSDFVTNALPSARRAQSIVVAVPADHPPLLRLHAAMRASALAEYFCHQGKKVLLMVDSLTRTAHAQREIGLALGEPPTMKGYPPSALALIPQLIERAGNDQHSGGSITGIYTVLADGGDLDDPIVDSTRAIVDGHIILSRKLSEKGVYPAIDLSRSLSRTMVDCVDAAHARAAARFRHLWSVHEENRDLKLMGAYVSGNDPVLDEAFARQSEMEDFIRQSRQELIAFDSARALLTEGFGV